MEKTTKALIIVSILLVVSVGIIAQNSINEKIETERIEQERVFQEKHDEGYDKGYQEGLTKQFTGDEKIIAGQQSIFNAIIKAVENGDEVRIPNNDEIIILIEKIEDEQ